MVAAAIERGERPAALPSDFERPYHLKAATVAALCPH
jgi:hypothetical protein